MKTLCIWISQLKSSKGTNEDAKEIENRRFEATENTEVCRLMATNCFSFFLAKMKNKRRNNWFEKQHDVFILLNAAAFVDREKYLILF